VDFGEFFVEVSKILLPLISLLVTALVAFGAEYLRQRSKSAILDRAITSVESVVKSAVLEVQQTVVDGLKERNGGKLSEEEIEQIKHDVLQSVRARLTTETMKELQGVTSDIEAYLISMIEAYVHVHKDFHNVIGKKQV
jgi:hypothetical protein